VNFNQETRKKIEQFAKEQSQYYLQEAEMTYMEKLRQEIGRGKKKVRSALGKLRSRSEASLEAENDMVLYMSDYMNDLIAEGLSEQEAFERAKDELKFRSETEKSADLQERFARYIESRDPADYEAIGLFYAAFIFLGVSIGGFIGFLSSGGRMMFLASGWIDTLIGTGVGLGIGLGLGLISNAILVLRNR
jgi:hypothetical protein